MHGGHIPIWQLVLIASNYATDQHAMLLRPPDNCVVLSCIVHTVVR